MAGPLFRAPILWAAGLPFVQRLAQEGGLARRVALRFVAGETLDDAVGAVAVHGVSGFLGMLWVGVFAAGYPTGINNVESSIGGQLMGMMTFLPLGFLSGWIASYVLRKANLLRVPRAVELVGLDLVEYGTLVYPEIGVVDEQVIDPDGRLVTTASIIDVDSTNGHGGQPVETLPR